jgi:hypothetical protein
MQYANGAVSNSQGFVCPDVGVCTCLPIPIFPVEHFRLVSFWAALPVTPPVVGYPTFPVDFSGPIQRPSVFKGAQCLGTKVETCVKRDER